MGRGFPDRIGPRSAGPLVRLLELRQKYQYHYTKNVEMQQAIRLHDVLQPLEPSN